ncbi:MAG: DUF4124 domain-containing protein [Oxalobacter sp.]|jgi:hypothetical protein|nr:MAG: DUF4124 domain-containing protein [Oxalobacter sp.]
MFPPTTTPHLSGLFLFLLLITSVSHAQIYKCVDENKRTYYSEKKDACKSDAVKMNVRSQPEHMQSPKDSAAYWGEQERMRKQRKLQEDYNKKNYEPRVSTRPKSLSGGRAGNTNQSRCNLARDILSGAVGHSNGAKTDDYDRRVAQRDVEKYCSN